MSAPIVQAEHLSKWYGQVSGLNDVTVSIPPGITGLLGPNGAGKSTLIGMMSGLLAPSAGTVTLDGEAVWQRQAVYRRIGLVPEREGMYDVLTGRAFVLANARRFTGDSLAFAFEILDRAHVGVTPGVDFGRNAEGYLRFSYAQSLERIQEAIGRIGRFLARHR